MLLQSGMAIQNGGCCGASSHATNVHLSMLDWHQMRTLLTNAAVTHINFSICRSLNTVDAHFIMDMDGDLSFPNR